MRTSVLLVFIAGCVTLALAQDDKPWFCRNYKCPGFTTKTTTDNYDIRTYGATTWLSTSIQTSTPWPTKDQKSSMFFKLFPYFMGRNNRLRRVKMAVPALFKVRKNADNDYDVTMMFYVNDSDPPSPRVSGTELVTRPAGDVYVRAFKQVTWPKDEEYDANVVELENAITDKSSFDSNTYYRASYNYPFDLRMKQHEIWFDQA